MPKSQCKLTFPGKGFFFSSFRPNHIVNVSLQPCGSIEKEKKKCLGVEAACLQPQHVASNVWHIRNIKIPTSVDYLKSCIVHEGGGGVYIYIYLCAKLQHLIPKVCY